MIFTPHELKPNSRLFRYKDSINSDKRILWCYDTYTTYKHLDYNSGCFDVSKDRVQFIHEKALGYSAKINPLSYNEPFIEKSTLQFKHDALIYNSPCTPKHGKVYEMLLDNSIEFRYFFCVNAPDFVIKKTRVKNDFSMAYLTTEIIDVPIKMRRTVESFSSLFGLDFGELDILEKDGLFYIIDVNNMAGNAGLDVNTKGANILYANQVKSL